MSFRCHLQSFPLFRDSPVSVVFLVIQFRTDRIIHVQELWDVDHWLQVKSRMCFLLVFYQLTASWLSRILAVAGSIDEDCDSGRRLPDQTVRLENRWSTCFCSVDMLDFPLNIKITNRWLSCRSLLRRVPNTKPGSRPIDIGRGSPGCKEHLKRH